MQGTRSQRVRTSGRRDECVTPARTLALTWSLSKPAAMALGHAGDHDPSVSLVLRIELHGESTPRLGAAAAAVHAGERVQSVGLDSAGPGVCITDPETGLTHIDIPGVLQCSLRLSVPEARERVLFARTPLLAKLGFMGGRYELLGGSLTP